MQYDLPFVCYVADRKNVLGAIRIKLGHLPLNKAFYRVKMQPSITLRYFKYYSDLVWYLYACLLLEKSSQ